MAHINSMGGHGIFSPRQQIWQEHRRFIIEKLRHLEMGKSRLEAT